MDKTVIRSLLFAFLALLFTAALSIPFVYESQTLWYKVGYNKLSLRAGQLAGLLAALLLFVQLVLGVRGKFLEELFGAAKLLRLHRANGFLLTSFAFLHIALVLLPEGLTNLPISAEFWPEMIGLLLFSLILVIVVSSLFRQQFGFAYHRWRLSHRIFAYTVPFLLVLHVLFVSDSFTHPVPRAGLPATLTGLFFWILKMKMAGRLKTRYL